MLHKLRDLFKRTFVAFSQGLTSLPATSKTLNTSKNRYQRTRNEPDATQDLKTPFFLQLPFRTHSITLFDLPPQENARVYLHPEMPSSRYTLFSRNSDSSGMNSSPVASRRANGCLKINFPFGPIDLPVFDFFESAPSFQYLLNCLTIHHGSYLDFVPRWPTSTTLSQSGTVVGPKHSQILLKPYLRSYAIHISVGA